MKVTLLIVACLTALSAGAPKDANPNCNLSNCVAPDCRCADETIPGGLSVEETPQFVLLTFDDSVTNLLYDNYYTVALDGRTNPDGCNVSATFYVCHEYTEYNLVHDLYERGHEIALHSVTHSSNTTYWADLTVDEMDHEFGDEKIIVTHFANIPDEALTGMRLPLLQMSGDVSFTTAEHIGLQYDCSWPTQSHHYWPYTLDYLSPQDCGIPPCPRDAHPGFWVQPMVEWTDDEGVGCSMVDACANIPTDTEGVLNFIIRNFNNHYTGNKNPFGFYVHAAWFDANPNHFEAYVQFLDYLKTLNDVYIVSVQHVIDWVKNPVPVGSDNWPTCKEVTRTPCYPNNCALQNDKGEERYMSICLDDCPINYPWLNNPLGE